jgi:hypothetical protein
MASFDITGKLTLKNETIQRTESFKTREFVIETNESGNIAVRGASIKSKEIPKLLNLYHEFQKENKDVKVFSVYVYHEVDKYIKNINDNKLDWINVYDGAYNNNVVDKYEVRSTPVIYILDENKVIKVKKIPVDKIKPFLLDLEK